MKRIVFALLMVVCAVVSATAQIGYQVTVFDEAKKAPKANQAVSATVTITDNSGKVICSDNISGTTDEFGILSMSVGNATTFSNVDWSKLPLWISATVDGVTISKTQILSVPVAEHAKHTGELTEDLLCSKTWSGRFSDDSDSGDTYSCVFYKNHTGTYVSNTSGDPVRRSVKWSIRGNMVSMWLGNEGWQMYYIPEIKSMLFFSRVGYILN